MTSKYVDGIHEERFDRFLADLRSGAFVQGTGTLHRKGFDGKPDEFCCLGVACYRAAAEGVVDRYDKEYRNAYGYSWNAGELPVEVAEWLGIPRANWNLQNQETVNINFLRMGWKTYDPEEDGLIEEPWYYSAVGLNDTLERDFNEIADAFEAEFLRVEE